MLTSKEFTVQIETEKTSLIHNRRIHIHGIRFRSGLAEQHTHAVKHLMAEFEELGQVRKYRTHTARQNVISPTRHFDHIFAFFYNFISSALGTQPQGRGLRLTFFERFPERVFLLSCKGLARALIMLFAICVLN